MIIKLILLRHLTQTLDILIFEGKVNQINPPEQQLNKANTSDTDALF